MYRRKPDFFLPPTADFLYLRLFSLPSGRRGGGWRGIAESSLSRYYTTHTDAQGEALKSHKSFCSFLCEYIQRISKRMRHITPTAKRNTYSVAFLLCIHRVETLRILTLGEVQYQLSAWALSHSRRRWSGRCFTWKPSNLALNPSPSGQAVARPTCTGVLSCIQQLRIMV